jgi:hypothetical protein
VTSFFNGPPSVPPNCCRFCAVFAPVKRFAATQSVGRQNPYALPATVFVPLLVTTLIVPAPVCPVSALNPLVITCSSLTTSRERPLPPPNSPLTVRISRPVIDTPSATKFAMRVPCPFTDRFELAVPPVATTLPEVWSSDRKLRPLVGSASTCFASRIDESSLSRVRTSGADAATVIDSWTPPTPS